MWQTILHFEAIPFQFVCVLQVCLWDESDVERIIDCLRTVSTWDTFVECCEIVAAVIPSFEHRPTEVVTITPSEVEMRYCLMITEVRSPIIKK